MGQQLFVKQIVFRIFILIFVVKVQTIRSNSDAFLDVPKVVSFEDDISDVSIRLSNYALR